MMYLKGHRILSNTVYRTETIPKSQYGHCVVRIVYMLYGNGTVPYRNVPKSLPIRRVRKDHFEIALYSTVPLLWSMVRYRTVMYGTAWRNATVSLYRTVRHNSTYRTLTVLCLIRGIYYLRFVVCTGRRRIVGVARAYM